MSNQLLNIPSKKPAEETVKEGYKQTKVGVIPADWKLFQLGLLGNPFTGLNGKSKEDFGNGKPYIPYLNIFNNPIINENSLDFVKIDDHENQNRILYGDLFFTTSSETPEEVGMSSTYLGKAQELYLNSFCFGFRLNDFETVLPEYLSYFFRGILGRKFMTRLAQGATRFNLSKSLLLKEEIPVPNLSEQKKIAEILITWDNAILKCEQIIVELKKRNKGLAQQLLTGKKRLKGFNGEWKTTQIGDIFKIENRHILWDDNAFYNLVSIKRRFGGLFFRGSFSAKEIQVKKLKEIKVNDFLISKRQVSHGAWSVVPKEFDSFLVSDEYDCLSIVNTNVLGSNFWRWFCQQPKMINYAFLDSKGVHIEKLIFHFKQFRKRKLMIPGTLAEQEAIASILDEANKELKLCENKLTILKEQKKCLMQKLLTGEVRVKTG